MLRLPRLLRMMLKLARALPSLRIVVDALLVAIEKLVCVRHGIQYHLIE